MFSAAGMIPINSPARSVARRPLRAYRSRADWRACSWSASAARSPFQILLLQHHVNPLGAVHHLRHAAIGGEAAQRIGVLARDAGARARERDHLAQRDDEGIVE